MFTKQNVKDVFEFKQGKVPYWLHNLSEWEGGAAARMDEYYKSNAWRNDFRDSILGTHIGFINAEAENGVVRDTFGVLLDQKNIAHVRKPALEEPDLSGFQWPDPKDMVNWQSMKDYTNYYKDRFQIWGLAMGLYERSCFLRGTENFLTDLVLEEDFVNDLLDGVMKVHINFMDYTLDQIPIDAYFGGDDFCDQRSCMFGVDRWRQFFKPRLKELIDHAHAKGVPYVLHSCGNVGVLVDDLIEIGLDGLESLQYEAMDVYEVKKKAENKMVLFGAVGVQNLLYSWTPEEIYNEVAKLYRELGRNGGYVIAPSKPIDPEPAENIDAFLRAIRDYNMG